jgi:16S rRNA (guanosine(1370)-2'-O)-methyltransferase
VFFIPTEDAMSWRDVDNILNYNDDTIVLVADNDTSKYDPSRVIEYDKIPAEIIAGKEIIVVIGGETHGVGEEARNFLERRNWRAINITLDKTVNSLNVSTALAVVLFELRRKLS